MKNYASLLDYKKSTKDWNYNPMSKSKDCEYVGRITDLNFKQVKGEIPEKKPEHAVSVYLEDFKNGKLIPNELSPNSLGATKLDHIRFGYNEHNSKYYQWIDSKDSLPDLFEKIKKLCGLEEGTAAIFKQDPGNTNPWHFDTYLSTLQKTDLKLEQNHLIRRYLIFLENWDWGHFIQVGNNVLANWKVGDIYTWKTGMYHLSCNAGIKPKWTCQITGKTTDKSIHKMNKKEFKIHK